MLRALVSVEHNESTHKAFFCVCVCVLLSVIIGGAGYSGLPVTDSVEGIDNMPYASRYVNCNGQTNSVCRKDGYNGVCWIEREDFEPAVKQGPMGGRAK